MMAVPKAVLLTTLAVAVIVGLCGASRMDIHSKAVVAKDKIVRVHSKSAAGAVCKESKDCGERLKCYKQLWDYETDEKVAHPQGRCKKAGDHGDECWPFHGCGTYKGWVTRTKHTDVREGYWSPASTSRTVTEWGNKGYRCRVKAQLGKQVCKLQIYDQ
ncbi:unnamed protein product [Vitrella brassicaformis CCMP3155]|uniref:Uncharacterized protein n=1 Tax=Vitrella brassicaformis (strain CCMP3155) TaxID=1169540 RepID=A0A0G4FWN3_VITBC|nr:unnamed protein product [Vitrella brassicaformis CCMP3155]|eukprot:CEM19628.1 unnamed protein product [Vitrella brassicaformis CCMP3155]